MSQKFGIENLKKVMDLAYDVEQLVIHMVKNGKSWAADIKDIFEHMPSLIMEIKALVDDGKKIPEEFKDLDSEEGAQLVAYMMAKHSVDGTKAQALVVAYLTLALHLTTDIGAIVSAHKLPAEVK
jgi:hypothetical protein